MTGYNTTQNQKIMSRAIIGVLALWLAFSGVAAAEQLYVNESGWWQEGGAFNASGAPIQAAVDNATAGDSVFVWNGSYIENVVVDTAYLTLEGEGADVVTVTAADSGDHVFEVTADYVNISGFTATGATDIWVAGVSLTSADHCNISRNIASNNYDGIYLSYSSDNTLMNNTANSNKQYGIYLWYYSSYNTLTSNTASDSYNSIWLSHSSDNTLTNNTANSNKQYGIRLSFYSSGNTLTSNTASNNYYGIRLSDSSNNAITCNWVRNNTYCGFYLSGGSVNNNISYNNIIENGNYNTETGGYEWQFYNDQLNPVEAKHNYWGAGMNSSTIDASIYDDEEGGGRVEFYPFETNPAPCSPTPEELPAFTTTDAVIALQIAVGSSPFDSRYDVSGDGSVTSLDALIILQAAAGSIEIG